MHWPDGHITKSLHQHMEDLMAMFIWVPDTRIATHTIKLADGEWTSVTSTMTGTFTRAMRFGPPNVIPATGKAYKIQLVTVAHWKNGVMDEEYLFWDNQEFNRQIAV
ncbi:MAG: ester cyclase [Kofleriaceae bacterium]|nr:ester cyclase [Kofleriaceae bacterium]